MFSDIMSIVLFISFICLCGTVIVIYKLRFLYRLEFFIIICFMAPFIERFLIKYISDIYFILDNVHLIGLSISLIMLLFGILLNYKCISSYIYNSKGYLYKIVRLLLSLSCCYICSILIRSKFFIFMKHNSRMTLNKYGLFKFYRQLLYIILLAVGIWIFIYIISVILVSIIHKRNIKERFHSSLDFFKKSFWYCYPNVVMSNYHSFYLLFNKLRYGTFLIFHNLLVYGAIFTLYGASYIVTMYIILICKYNKYFGINISNEKAMSVIKIVALFAMVVPIIFMALILAIYSHMVIEKRYKNIIKRMLNYDLLKTSISTILSAIGINSIILSIFSIVGTANDYVNISPIIIIIVASMLLAYTIKFIVHTKFIINNPEYYCNHKKL